jgi:3-phenylpropionate/trans-cinnamate dioxygenase ferredoxin subunit
MGHGHFVTVATRSEIPPGGMKAVEVGGVQVLVCNVNGEYYAVHDECTHECFPLSEGSLDGHTVICMLHGASFDVRTGDILAPPAYESLKTYRVRVDGEEVDVAID